MMLDEAEQRGMGWSEKIRVFVSYDREHDGDLYDRLEEQASTTTSGFQISARSGGARPPTDRRDQELRREIRESGAAIIICGEHTDSAERVSCELQIAREEERPYFLLWGRREFTCTKPTAARSTDGMYSWTWEVLQDQILSIRRAAQSNERLAELSRVKNARKARPQRPG